MEFIPITIAAILAALLGQMPGQHSNTNVSLAEIKAHLAKRYKETPKWDKELKHLEHFAWKDFVAMPKGQTFDEFVVGCLEPNFARRLYNLSMAAEKELGFKVGYTGICRNDPRQALIKSGFRAKNPCETYHGGSCHHGVGRAADLVALPPIVEFEYGLIDRIEQVKLNTKLYLWIERRGEEFGLGLPYGTKDAGHVAPLDGKEFSFNFKPYRSWVSFFSSHKTKMFKRLAEKKKSKRYAKKFGKKSRHAQSTKKGGHVSYRYKKKYGKKRKYAWR